jgi:hypothetical protein
LLLAALACACTDERKADQNLAFVDQYEIQKTARHSAVFFYCSGKKRNDTMPTFLPFTSDEEIIVIGRGLLDRTLPKAAWTHSAHFAAVMWLLQCRPELKVSREMPGLIRAYNEATGGANTDTSGYHETITQASIRAARAFLSGAPPQPLFVTCNALMRSYLGQPEWLLDYWTRSRLFSVEARRAWIEPDIRRLPF